MTVQLDQFKSALTEIVTDLENEFISFRGSRPTVKLVENIAVEAYGNQMLVKQLGSIAINPPREIAVTVWDRGLAPAVAKAIETALAVNPRIDNTVIYVNLPPLTKERKAELSKIAGKTAESVRIRVRAAREQINKKIDAALTAKTITEDDRFDFKDKVQKITGAANQKIEDLLTTKLKEME